MRYKILSTLLLLILTTLQAVSGQGITEVRHSDGRSVAPNIVRDMTRLHASDISRISQKYDAKVTVAVMSDDYWCYLLTRRDDGRIGIANAKGELIIPIEMESCQYLPALAGGIVTVPSVTDRYNKLKGDFRILERRTEGAFLVRQRSKNILYNKEGKIVRNDLPIQIVYYHGYLLGGVKESELHYRVDNSTQTSMVVLSGSEQRVTMLDTNGEEIIASAAGLTFIAPARPPFDCQEELQYVQYGDVSAEGREVYGAVLLNNYACRLPLQSFNPQPDISKPIFGEVLPNVTAENCTVGHASGQLIISCRKAAHLYVDGYQQPLAPTTLTLSEGRHYIRVERQPQRYYRYLTEAEVKEYYSDEVKAEFKPLPLKTCFLLMQYQPECQSMGAMAGYAGRWGGFVRGVWKGSDDRDEDSDDNGTMRGKDDPIHRSFTGGLLVRTLPFLYAYAGAGYGKYSPYSFGKYGHVYQLEGVALDLGVVARWKYLALSLGYNTVLDANPKPKDARFGELSLGIGVAL